MAGPLSGLPRQSTCIPSWPVYSHNKVNKGCKCIALEARKGACHHSVVVRLHSLVSVLLQVHLYSKWNSFWNFPFLVSVPFGQFLAQLSNTTHFTLQTNMFIAIVMETNNCQWRQMHFAFELNTLKMLVWTSSTHTHTYTDIHYCSAAS